MALFGNLFKKKSCAICGGEIGLLGNRKLADGNMCKECAAKLSPWFDERRQSTVAQIQDQLAYREQNRIALEGFKPTRAIGDYYKMIIEEKNGVPYRFVLSSADDWRQDNPDLFLFTDVISCELDISDYERELKRRNADGEEESYFPARYEIRFDFYVKLMIDNNPYVDDVRFKLNRSSVVIHTERNKTGFGMFLGNKNNYSYDPTYRGYEQIYSDIKLAVDAGRNGVGPESEAEKVQEARPKFCSG
jgi:hypothetical protein